MLFEMRYSILGARPLGCGTVLQIGRHLSWPTRRII